MIVSSFTPLFYTFRRDHDSPEHPGARYRFIEVREVLESKLCDWTHAVLDVPGHESATQRYLVDLAAAYATARYGRDAFDLIDENDLTPRARARRDARSASAGDGGSRPA